VTKVADSESEFGSSSKTLTEVIFNRLRGDILRCRLRPGDRLRVDELRITYGTGGTPVREALSRLSSIGLVRAEGQRGFTVAEVSPADLIDLTRVRIWVETTALRSAIQRGDRDWEAEILAAAHRLGTDQPKTDSVSPPALDPRWEKHHRDFHTALVRACDSPRLMSYRELLGDMSNRYRHLSVAVGVIGRDPAQEHRAIMTAVLERDAVAAAKLIGDHFLETARIVLIGFSGLDDTAAAQMLDPIRHELL
jgi:GntR family carbon starvation induced transcriptional regulator